MKKSRQIVTILILLVAVLSLSACGAALSDAAKLQEYDVGGEKIPTPNAVIGEERKVTSVESSTTNGMPQQQYTYESATVFDDLNTYFKYLTEDGWAVTESYDLNVMPGSAQFGKESSEEGKILIVSAAFEDTAYAVKITKMEGTLNHN